MNLFNEHFEFIPNFSNYVINENGTKIFNLKTKNFLKIHEEKRKYKLKDGYYSKFRVELSDGQGNKKKFLIHLLVYETFNGVIPKGMQVDHIDNNSKNNNYKNLQLLTSTQNLRKRFVDDLSFGKKLNLYLNSKERREKAAFKKMKKIICNETGIIYNSIKEASEKVGLSKGAICGSCKHGNKCKNLTFKYI